MAHKQADVTKRLVAAIIDAVVAVMVGMIPIAGAVIATLYWLLRDGLDLPFMDRRSIGKKLVGTRPVRLDGAPMDVTTSFRRNWVLCVGVILWPLVFVPILGWALILIFAAPVSFIALVLLIVEVVLVITADDGRRWGDRLAGTRVIESRD